MRSFWLILLISFFLNPIFAQSLRQLESAIEALDRDIDMRSASWGITVIDANTGEVLVNHNGRKSLATASTMKAITTSTALALLGEEFRFNTYLEYDGQIDEAGTLTGNLYIRGEGDPSLGSDRFDGANELNQLMIRWAKEIQAIGIKAINGQIIGDGSAFSTQIIPGKWNWEDMGNYYAAGAGGLNINENLYQLVLKPGPSEGAETSVLRTIPTMQSLTFTNELKTGRRGSGDNAYIYGAPYTQLAYIRGTIPAGVASFTIKGSIPDPALFCAERLSDELTKCGIRLNQPPTSVRLLQAQGKRKFTSRKPIYTHSSPTLREIVYHTNMKSVNLFAEALAIQVGKAQGKIPNTANGIDAIEDYWKSKGIDIKGMYLRDGSGLSSNNVVSTYQMAGILQKMRSQQGFNAFYASLPVAGKSGSLKSMLRGTAAEGRLRAKSGYISAVRSYTGYVTTVNGRELTFAVIANNFSCGAGAMRRKLEVLMAKMAAGN